MMQHMRTRSHQCLVASLLILLGSTGNLVGQTPDKAAPAETGVQVSDSASTEALKRDFFALIRNGDTERFLSYISKEGVGVGSQPQHETRKEVEQQMEQRRGLYCKLFESSCINASVKLDAGVGACSYRQALRTRNVHLTAAETV